MNRLVTSILFTGALTLAVLLSPMHALADIRLGILPRLSAIELNHMFTPLADYLTKETGEKVQLIIPKDFDAFTDMVKSNKLDIGFANPLVYVKLKSETDITPIVLATEPKWGAKFRGVVISRRGSGIDSIQNLKGKKLIFVDKNSAVYLTGMLLLSKAGFDLKKDFTLLPFAKKVENVVLAVHNKSADAGVVREDDLEKVKDKVELDQLKVIGYTDYVPNWSIFSLPETKRDTVIKIKSALMKLKPNSDKSSEVLSAAHLTGFVHTTDKDYDQLRAAVKQVEKI